MKIATPLAFAICLAASTGYALVNAGNPLGNTTAPTGSDGQPTDPGWSNVGSVRSASGVYLGSGWVLTATHVGAGNFTSSTGTVYTWDGVNVHSIAGTDLTLFKLSTTPDLPSVSLAQSAAPVGAEVVMIGNGRSPSQATSQQYFIDTDTDPWTWSTSDFPESDGSLNGYLTNSTRTLRWGTNTIDAYASESTSGLGHYFYTTFNLAGGTAYEAQAVIYDSGGAVFYHDGQQWRLSGIMASVGLFPDQPGSNTSAFDGNRTYIVDISRYVDEIQAIIPEPSLYALAAAALLLPLAILRRQRTRSRG